MATAGGEGAEAEALGRLGEGGSLVELRAAPLMPAAAGAAPAGGYVASLAAVAPLALLCDALAARLSAEAADVALLFEGRVLDASQTLEENGVLTSGSAPETHLLLHFELWGRPMVTRDVVKSLVGTWRKDPPDFSQRPPLAELINLTTGSQACEWARAAFCTAYGPRISNEDAHICQCDWTTLPSAGAETGAPAALFAVCDGHGGVAASQHLSEHLGAELQSELSGCREAGAAGEEGARARRAAFERGFLAADERLGSETRAGSITCGTTCIVAAVFAADASATGGDYRVLLANVGDSRALLYRTATDSLAETRDHKPDEAREKRRIRSAGGWVLPADSPAPARLDGILATSRAFGDFRFKADAGRAPEGQKVVAVPEVCELEASSGDLLLLACDGIFDVLSSTEVMALALRSLECGGPEGQAGDAEAATATVVWAALQRGTNDNTTCLVVQLGK